MNRKESVSYCMDALKKVGADKATCSMNMTEKKELNITITLKEYDKLAAGLPVYQGNGELRTEDKLNGIVWLVWLS